MFPWSLKQSDLDGPIAGLIGAVQVPTIRTREKMLSSGLLEMCWSGFILNSKQIIERKQARTKRLKRLVPMSICNRRIVRFLQSKPTKALWLVRCGSTVLLSTLALAAFLSGIPLAPPPARGEMAIVVTFFVNALATLLVFLVVGFVMLQTLTLRQILYLIRRELRWPSTPTSRDVKHAYDLVSWIERASGKSTQGLLLPSALILAFVVSRLPIWDGWHLNSAILSTLLIPLGLTLIAAIALRRESHQLRDRIVELLQEFHLSLDQPNDAGNANDQSKGPLAKYVDSVLKQIKGLTRGAFQDVWHDPILGSFLLFATTILTGQGQDIFKFLRHFVGLE
jgi:hypothetical protein